MPIKFRCPHCEQFLGIADSKAGTLADCPTCGQMIFVPKPESEELPKPEMLPSQQDVQLRQALSELATLQRTDLPVVIEESHARPEIVSESKPRIELEVIAQPRSIVPAVPVPVAHVEDAPGAAVSTADALAQLAALPVNSGVRQLKGCSSKISFSPALVLAITLAALGVGGFLGAALQPRKVAIPPAKPLVEKAVPAPPVKPAPVAAPPASPLPELHGRVTYTGNAGEQLPDQAARILILPMDRRGTVKLPPTGLRVGSDEVDRQVLTAAVGALGGNLGLAGGDGKYRVPLPATGRFGLLFVSTYQSRPATVPPSEECQKFLNLYFERADLLLGNVEYQFQELPVDQDQLIERNVNFAAR